MMTWLKHENYPFAYAGRMIILIGLGLVLSGCEVTLKYPLGKVIKPDKDVFEGIWQAEDDQILYMKVHDDDYTLKVAAVDWYKKEKGFELYCEKYYITRDKNGRFYFHLRDRNMEYPGFNIFKCAVSENKKSMIIWEPNEKEFARAVENKILSGKVKRNEDGELTGVYVDSPSSKVLTFIENQANSFIYKDPDIQRKIGKISEVN